MAATDTTVYVLAEPSDEEGSVRIEAYERS
jgi:hypothetical protein